MGTRAQTRAISSMLAKGLQDRQADTYAFQLLIRGLTRRGELRRLLLDRRLDGPTATLHEGLAPPTWRTVDTL
eukprot:6942359-Pyramimonas_sp.AAC.1